MEYNTFLISVQGVLMPQVSEVVSRFVRRVIEHNAAHVAEVDEVYQDIMTAVQSPKATVVMCADARVQKAAFDREMSNDLFIVRNIGNQIMTSEGSVEYGVVMLKTPVLMIVGHPQCGAVRACVEGDFFSDFAPHIRKELGTMYVTRNKHINQGVIENVHRQVDLGCAKFADLVARKQLAVIGALYDFRNDYGHGHDRLIFINVNGKKGKGEVTRILGQSENSPFIGVATVTEEE